MYMFKRYIIYKWVIFHSYPRKNALHPWPSCRQQPGSDAQLFVTFQRGMVSNQLKPEEFSFCFIVILVTIFSPSHQRFSSRLLFCVHNLWGKVFVKCGHAGHGWNLRLLFRPLHVLRNVTDSIDVTVASCLRAKREPLRAAKAGSACRSKIHRTFQGSKFLFQDLQPLLKFRHSAPLLASGQIWWQILSQHGGTHWNGRASVSVISVLLNTCPKCGTSKNLCLFRKIEVAPIIQVIRVFLYWNPFSFRVPPFMETSNFGNSQIYLCQTSSTVKLVLLCLLWALISTRKIILQLKWKPTWHQSSVYSKLKIDRNMGNFQMWWISSRLPSCETLSGIFWGV